MTVVILKRRRKAGRPILPIDDRRSSSTTTHPTAIPNFSPNSVANSSLHVQSSGQFGLSYRADVVKELPTFDPPPRTQDGSESESAGDNASWQDDGFNNSTKNEDSQENGYLDVVIDDQKLAQTQGSTVNFINASLSANNRHKAKGISSNSSKSNYTKKTANSASNDFFATFDMTPKITFDNKTTVTQKHTSFEATNVLTSNRLQASKSIPRSGFVAGSSKMLKIIVNNDNSSIPKKKN